MPRNYSPTTFGEPVVSYHAWNIELAEPFGRKAQRKGDAMKELTLARLVPSLLLLLPPVPVGCTDREDPEVRGALERLIPLPTAGDMERGGTFGGATGSMPGDRRCELLAFILDTIPPVV